MIDADILLAKTGNIHNCLRRIRDVTGLEPDRLDEIDVQDLEDFAQTLLAYFHI